MIKACEIEALEIVISKRSDGTFWLHCPDDKRGKIVIRAQLRQYKRIEEFTKLHGHYYLR